MRHPPALSGLLDRPTPLLEWGACLLKLEVLRPTGGVEDRAVSKLSGPGVIEAGPGGALAAAAWARAQRWDLVVKPRGLFTHEVRKTLELWGVAIDPDAQPTVHGLDDPESYAGLREEMAREYRWRKRLVVAPAGAVPALRAVAEGLDAREVLAVTNPELPDGDLRGAPVPALPVSYEEAAWARRRLARKAGLLVSHLSAAAALYGSSHGGVALLTSAGEREFSLDRDAA